MSQRASGYERKERDLYETPEWVTDALVPHLPIYLLSGSHVWEPACASGKMLRVLQDAGFHAVGTDIETGTDFLETKYPPDELRAIITNPPYETAEHFINMSLHLTEGGGGLVAMLLRTDYDHAKTRGYMFGAHKAFAKKIVLTKRIKWFEDSKGQPSFNHAWFIWDWQHKGPPVLAYGPGEQTRH